MSKLVSITKKPRAPRSALNWLLGAHVRAVSSNYAPNGLLFKTNDEFDDGSIANAPKGFFPDSYTVLPHPMKLDPTCEMIIGRHLLEEMDVSSSNIGRASIFAEKQAQSFISTMFGEFIREWEVVAMRALATEKAASQGLRKKLSENRNVYQGDGDIMAFLAATGELVGTEFGLSTMDTVNVQEIVSKATDMIKRRVKSLSQQDYVEGYDHTLDAVGFGTMPHDMGPVTLLKAGTYEALYEAPLRRVMKFHHSRLLYKEILRSRIPDKGVLGVEEDFILSEGTDLVFFPAGLMMKTTNFEEFFTLLEEMFNQMQDTGLTHAAYERNQSDFTDQFWTTGDLVQAIYVDQTVTPYAGSNLEVALAGMVREMIGPVGNQRASMKLGHLIPGTGGPGSVSFIKNATFNVISGMDRFYVDYAAHAEAGKMAEMKGNHSLQCLLPNGVLDMSSPATCTLSNWLEFLTWYGTTQSEELRTLNRKATPVQTKMDYKFGDKVNLQNSGENFAAIIAASQRNGVLTKVFGSFNPDAAEKGAQQGPTLLDPSMGTVGPAVFAGMNDWTRADEQQPRLLALDGRRIKMPDGELVGSEFTGQHSRGNSPAGLITPRIPTQSQFGLADIDLVIANNLVSIPLSLDGSQALPTSLGKANSSKRINLYTKLTTAPRDISASGFIEFNLHPTEGFKRGLVFGKSMAGSHTDSSSMIDKLLGWSREGTSSVSVDFQWYNRGYPNVVHTASTILESQIGSKAYSSLLGVGVQEAMERYATEGIDFQNIPYYDVTSSDNTPKNTWYWDPSRTEAVGHTNRNFYGQVYDDVCFSAAQPYIPEVAVGAIKTRDLQSDLDSHTTNAKVTLLAKKKSMANEPGFSNSLGIGFDEQIDVALYDGRVEQDEAAYPAVRFNNGWTDRLDIINEAAARMHVEEFATELLDGDIIDGATGSLYDSFESSLSIHGLSGLSGGRVRSGYVPTLSVMRRNYAHTNGCSPHTFNMHCLSTLNPMSGIRAAAIVFETRTTSDSHRSTIENYFDGPNPTPCNADSNVLIVSGNGICRDYSFGHYPYSPLGWLLSTLTGFPEASDGAAHIMSSYAPIKAAPGTNFREITDTLLPPIPSISVDIPAGVVTAMKNGIGVPTSPNSWFKSAKHAGLITHGYPLLQQVDPEFSPVLLEMRDPESDLAVPNPWKRKDNDGYGVERVKYSRIGAVHAITDTIAEGLIAQAKALRAPFTNDLFRDIQTQGV